MIILIVGSILERKLDYISLGLVCVDYFYFQNTFRKRTQQVSNDGYVPISQPYSQLEAVFMISLESVSASGDVYQLTFWPLSHVSNYD